MRLWDVRCAGCAGELEQCQGILDSATPVECGLMALRLKLGCFVLAGLKNNNNPIEITYMLHVA